MSSSQLKAARRAIQQIALREGVPVEHVRSNMQVAMLHGMSSTDPQAQSFWKSIPRKGSTPTPEEFIAHTIGVVKQRQSK